MSDRDTNLAQAVLGRDADEFLRSELGRYLVERARTEEQIAIDELCNAKPGDAALILELQGRIWRARALPDWLAELVQDGLNAERALEAEEYAAEQ